MLLLKVERFFPDKDSVIYFCHKENLNHFSERNFKAYVSLHDYMIFFEIYISGYFKYLTFNKVKFADESSLNVIY